jgi:FTR1 family protein
MINRDVMLIMLTLLGLLFSPGVTGAKNPSPAQAAETLRAGLLQAQLALTGDPAEAQRWVAEARETYADLLAARLAEAAPETQRRIEANFAAAEKAVRANDGSALAMARAQIWTGLLAGSYRVIETSLQNGQGQTAREWLPLREFRPATRFSRPNADATLAVKGAIQGQVTFADALLAVRADLLDTYQARLNESLSDLESAAKNGFAVRRAEHAALAVITNAAVIVFREGLEAVLILASLLGSLKAGENRKYRRPLWWGAALALVVTALIWLLAHGILTALARFGERLEAIVSLLAIGVLLLITNWFFHQMYWTDWLARFHSQKRHLLSGETGLMAGLLMLGFTSVYREGFETVLFLQALVLEGGLAVVLSGVAIGLAATSLVGIITFAVQTRLPYKKMLIVTGIMIGGVLLVMVGHTTHVLQVVGWLPIHPIVELPLPFWTGVWFGVYPTWEGILLQAATAVFVIGSYYFAEWQKKQRRSPALRTFGPSTPDAKASG